MTIFSLPEPQRNRIGTGNYVYLIIVRSTVELLTFLDNTCVLLVLLPKRVVPLVQGKLFLIIQSRDNAPGHVVQSDWSRDKTTHVPGYFAFSHEASGLHL